jgi:hypothetical protein
MIYQMQNDSRSPLTTRITASRGNRGEHSFRWRCFAPRASAHGYLSNEKYGGIDVAVKKNVLTMQAHNSEQEGRGRDRGGL